MTDEDKKLVFDYMGWKLINTKPIIHPLDGSDMVAAISRMVGVDGSCTDWIEFDLFVKESGVKSKSSDWLLSHIPWLMQPARFFELMAKWLEVRNAKI